MRNFQGSTNSNASGPQPYQQCQRRRHPEKAHIKENDQQGRENISNHSPCQSASSGCSPRFVRKSMADTFKTPSKHATKVRSTHFQSLDTPLIWHASVLRLEPKDTDALQTKLFLLSQTEQYNGALEMIDSGEDKDVYAFEKAYTLYRLQCEQEAGQILEEIKTRRGPDRGITHLEAQMVNTCLFRTVTRS